MLIFGNKYTIMSTKIINFFMLLSISFSYSQYTDQINSNRPGESMGAFAVGKTIIQVESGIGYLKEKHSLLNTDAKGFTGDLALRYGLFMEQLEVIGNFSYQMDTYTTPIAESKRNGFKNSTLGFKYMIYDPFYDKEDKPDLYSWKANHKFKWSQFIPVVSAYVGANFNLNNPYLSPNAVVGKVSPKAMLITQNIFTSGLVLVTNVFYDRISTDYQSLGYVVTLTKGFNDEWSGFVENKGIKGDYYSDGIFTIGAAHLFDKNFQVDASISANFKNTPSIAYANIGFSWRYDAKYQEVKIFSGKSKLDKKMIKNKEKVNKKNAKRLDQLDEKK
jgi:hypothetical protein